MNLLILGEGDVVNKVTSNPSFEEAKNKEIEINCEYCKRNKGKHPGQLHHSCNFFFLVLLNFICGATVSIRF